jgi:hypothetical protein
MTLAFVALVLTMIGAGRFSVDAVIARRLGLGEVDSPKVAVVGT